MNNSKINETHCDMYVKKMGDDHNSQKADDHSNHGAYESKGLWKILISLPAFVFAIWNTVFHISNGSVFVPEWMANPWFMFTLATFTLVIFTNNYILPVIKSIRKLKLSISLFLAISLLTIYIYSLVQMARYYNEPNLLMQKQMFAEVIEISIIIFIGAQIENIVSNRTKKDLNSLLALHEKKAILYIDGKESEVDSRSLSVGDIVLIKNGSKFPVDGIIKKGKTTVDESLFTGESIPVNKKIGSKVFGGSISQGETLLVEVTSIFTDSTVSKLISSVETVRADKSAPAKMAEKFSKFVLPFILFVGILAFLITGFLGDWEQGVKSFVTTIIVACPMSYILLTPTSSLISSSIALKKGIIYKTSDIFENIKQINAIAFDKTGTLTEGKLSISKSTIPDKFNSLVYSMESVSTHPIAKSIVKSFEFSKKIDINPTETAGKGVHALFEGKKYYLGSLSYIKEHSSYQDEKWIIAEKKKGSTFSYLLEDNKVVGVLQLQDKIKDSAKTAISKFHEAGIETFILTGDNRYSAEYIAEKLNISLDNVYYDLKPEDKQEIITKLQSEGKNVAFVGDGINDIIALEKSDIGISIGDGSDIAINSSDISLQKNDLNLIIESLRIAKATLKTISFGIVISTIYIVTIVPIAAAGLVLPFFAGVFMVVNDLLPLLVSSTLFRLKRN